MRKLHIIAITTAIAIGMGMMTVIAGNYGAQKVVYHVNYDNPKRQKGALRNIQNHINAVGADKLDMRIVMHGKGWTLLASATKDLDLQQKIISLKDQGVKFNLCGITISRNKLDKKDLFDLKDSDIVPSGVAEIAYLQSQGFAYLRP